jgi:hypothetical protein
MIYVTSWNRLFLEKLPVVQLLKNFRKIDDTWRFSTMFTWALHLAVSWASWTHTPPPILCPQDPF